MDTEFLYLKSLQKKIQKLQKTYNISDDLLYEQKNDEDSQEDLTETESQQNSAQTTKSSSKSLPLSQNKGGPASKEFTEVKAAYREATKKTSNPIPIPKNKLTLQDLTRGVKDESESEDEDEDEEDTPMTPNNDKGGHGSQPAGRPKMTPKPQQKIEIKQQKPFTAKVPNARQTPYKCAHQIQPGVFCGKGCYAKYCYQHKKLKCHRGECD